MWFQTKEVGAVSTWLIQKVEVWLSDSAIVVKIVWTLRAFHLKEAMVLASFSVFYFPTVYLHKPLMTSTVWGFVVPVHKRIFLKNIQVTLYNDRSFKEILRNKPSST